MNYNINHIVVFVGICVVAISFYLIFQKKENDSAEEYLLSPSSLGQEEITFTENLFRESNTKVKMEIKELRAEIMNLASAIQEIHGILEEKKFEDKTSNDGVKVNDNFNHLLNYNQFLNKNKPIIDLSKQNKTSEEIAKTLNKSVREIEMVLKLIK